MSDFGGVVSRVGTPAPRPVWRQGLSWFVSRCVDFPLVTAAVVSLVVSALVDLPAMWILFWLVLAGLVLFGVWRRVSLRDRRARRGLHRRWRGTPESVGLAASVGLVSRTGAVPAIRAFERTTDLVVSVTLDLPPGMHPDAVRNRLDSLAAGFGVMSARMGQVLPGRVTVRLLLGDPLAESITIDSPMDVADDLTSVPLGVSEGGDLVDLPLSNRSGAVIGGEPGSGKSGSIAGLLASLARSPAVQLAGLDGKGGFELEWLRARCFDFLGEGETAAGALAVIERVRALMEARIGMTMPLGRARNWAVSRNVDSSSVISELSGRPG